ncbi:hypothetical protein EDB86DRAFT_445029 [Lactarius hatsudake]|nr:hypothetical protein EDB86DRAFT_445029 [Lactarius hatsudake]
MRGGHDRHRAPGSVPRHAMSPLHHRLISVLSHPCPPLGLRFPTSRMCFSLSAHHPSHLVRLRCPSQRFCATRSGPVLLRFRASGASAITSDACALLVQEQPRAFHWTPSQHLLALITSNRIPHSTGVQLYNSGAPRSGVSFDGDEHLPGVNSPHERRRSNRQPRSALSSDKALVHVRNCPNMRYKRQEWGGTKKNLRTVPRCAISFPPLAPR